MADLALESTDDLLSEIARRYDIGAFAGMQIEGAGKDRNAYKAKWWGNRHTAAGLATGLVHRMLAEFDSEAEVVPPDWEPGEAQGDRP